MKESYLLNVDYSNYYDILVKALGKENKASYMINLIQAQLLDDIIKNTEDVIRDIAGDLPRYVGKEFVEEHAKMMAFVQINRELIDTWTEKYNNMNAYKEKLNE